MVKPFYTHWEKDGYEVFLFKGKVQDNRQYYSYEFTDKTVDVKFSGNDFSPSPMSKSDEDIVYQLLGFLSCQPEDVDEEFFNDYTDRQRIWAESYRAENLKYLVNDFEEKNN
jgi:hypothetical protein